MADPTRVVIDCDTGVDDTMAIFYGLLAPQIDVVGIACVWGNIGVDLTTTNTLRLLEMLGRPEIPVARGAEKPLIGPMWPLDEKKNKIKKKSKEEGKEKKIR